MKRQTVFSVLKNKYYYIVLIALAYVYWAISFIYKTSFIASNGQRYFCLFDDAMVSMRYAWNLVHGNGLAWNPGEYIEGITNMLMTLYMSIATFLFNKNMAVFAIQISGIAFMLAAAFFCLKIGSFILSKYNVKNPGFFEPLFFAMPLFYFPLSFWTLLGMETGMLTVLLLASIWVAIRIDGLPKVKPLLPILLGLAFLTRPDAAVPIALIFLYRLSGIIREKDRLKVILGEMSIVAAFVLGITLFRVFYYGSPIPNTYALKMVGMSLSDRIENGIIFIFPFIKLMLFPLCIAIFSVLMSRKRISTLILFMMLTAIGYQVYVGGDFFEYWRMLAPYVPLVLILCLVEIAEINAARAETGRPVKETKGAHFFTSARTRNTLVLAAFLVFVFRFNWLYHKEILLTRPAASVESNHYNVNVALALCDITTSKATVGLTWGGTIPYYTGRRAIDFLGKSDKYIASLPADMSGKYSILGMNSVPGHNKYDLDYSIVKLKPTYIQHPRYGIQNKEKYVRKNYKLVKYKKVLLWLRKDSPYVRWEKLDKK
jgi:arabinofuranosyltransferase